MNVKNAVAALKPLEGHHILIITDESPRPIRHLVHSQPCLRVQHLPPDQRQPGQGNIILWDGGFTRDGLQTGGTFWAKDVRFIRNYGVIACIHTRNKTKISIIMWKLQ